MAALRRSLHRLAQAAPRRAPRAREADGGHTAFSWLAEGLTTTATAKGRLLPALHALDVRSDWILLDCRSSGRLWEQKLQTYADPLAEGLYARQLEGTRGAQQEVLELLLEHLPRRYPDSFEIFGPAAAGSFSAETRIRVSGRDFEAEYRVGDHSDFPLRLASLLVQEDLVLLRGHAVVAGTVHCSFSDFGTRRVGQDLQQLHANVPQYAQDLRRPVSRIFDSLAPERPCWRTNWDLAWSPRLLVDAGPQRYPHRTASSGEEKAGAFEDIKRRIARVGFAQAAFLKVEYQTLRRLPRHSDCMLFTVRSFVEPFTKLAERPGAARNLAAIVRRLEGADFSKYLGIDDVAIRSALLDYADGIAKTAEAKI